MKIFSSITLVLTVAMTLVIATPVFAESAPVYDGDSLQQQFDNSLEAGPELPPPPPPEQEGAFVPSQSDSSPIGVAPPSPQMRPMSPEQRLRRVEQQINNMQSTEATARLDSLQEQVQVLRGQVEQLTHQIEQMQNQQKTLYSDLDKRLTQQSANIAKLPAKLNSDETAPYTNGNEESIVSATATTQKSSRKDKIANKKLAKVSEAEAASKDTEKLSDDQPNVAEEQQIYQTAYNLIKAKKYSEAVTALQNMLQKYPSGTFAANAHYWLGELFGLMGKHDEALAEFTTVVKNHPESPRVSDAQLKVGLIYASELKWADAKAAFKKVINRYPGTASARLASDQLKKIQRAGN